MKKILDIQHLSIQFKNGKQLTTAVDDISFSVAENQFTAIVGESGSGKSLTALSILQLLPSAATVTGRVLFSDADGVQDILTCATKKLLSLRGNRIAMVFQEPMTALNPLMTCGKQVAEVLVKHLGLNKANAKAKAIELFTDVELPQPSDIYDRYPHQISGGQKQRVMIAMAIGCNPALLIADEPTTALDVVVQKNIMELLKKMQQKHQLTVLMITHDIDLVATIADEVLVMYKGKIIEKGMASTVLKHPLHPYTKALIACKPSANKKGKPLPILEEGMMSEIENTAIFFPKKTTAEKQDKLLLSIRDLTVAFPAKKNIWGKAMSMHTAVNKVSLYVNQNEIVGLVGESGCGKTSLGNAILQLVEPVSGSIELNGKLLTKNTAHIWGKEIQMVFQDPYSSLHPRLKIGDAIMEPMKVHRLFGSASRRKEKTIDLLEQVGLSSDSFGRYPHQFSGGQRQRVCIARALAMEPSFMVFDESVSALDVSMQAQVLNLINELKQSHQFTALFISHDLSVIHYISDRIYVMKSGEIVETGNANDIFNNPQHEYTRELIGCITGNDG